MNSRLSTAAAAAMLALMLSASAARAADDCETVLENVEDAVQIATKVLEGNLAEVTKDKPTDDKEKTSVKNRFCAASGEFLGTSRAYRAVASECLRGAKLRNTVASLDESIKSLQGSIAKTCN